MNNPKISVIMPVYNAEKFLREAIDSILNQTFKDFEFLIINDASTDRSNKIILSYIDPRIRFLENDKNLGSAETRNKGLKIAKGNLIALMDADDISMPNRFELQYEKMQKDKKIIVLASIYNVMDEHGKFLYTEKHALSSEEIYYTLQFRNCLGQSTIMFRKEIILKKFKGYDGNHEAEDYNLWLKASSNYKISKINTCLLHLRTSRSSRMGTSNRLDDDAMLLAKRNLEVLTGTKIKLNTLQILRRNFTAFRSSSSIKFSKEEIREAIMFLNKVNNKILTHHSTFLNSFILRKITTKKLNLLKFDLFLAELFDIKFGFMLKFLFKIYFTFERMFIRKFTLSRF